MHYCGASSFEAQRGLVIWYSMVRSGEIRVAAVLVERSDFNAARAGQLIQRIEEQLSVPVMLVARDETVWAGAKVHANFEAEPYLYALIEAREVEWAELGLMLEDAA